MLTFSQKLKNEALRQSQLKVMKEDLSAENKKLLEEIWSKAKKIASTSNSEKKSKATAPKKK